MTSIKNILIIEDDPSIQKLFEITFSINKEIIYKIIDDGSKTLKTLENFQPDVILLDVMLPIQDGYQTFDQINNLNKKIPVIFITANNYDTKIESYLKAGVRGIIFKPFSPSNIIEKINNILKIKK